jgi:radical SAM-linked protein
VRFSKTGALTYVSHLDLVRNVMRALVKSRLPLWYTEGFNPKPKLTFASSLSVGCSGERELFDVKVTEEISDEEVCERLREAMPDGIKIIEAYTPERKFSEVRYAENEIVFHLDEPIEDAEALCRAAETLFDNPVVVMKRSKSGEKETDISPMVKSVSAKAGDRSITVTAVTAADSAGYLNPMYVAQSVSAMEGFPHARYYSLTRKRLLDGDGVTEFR